jgi:hypothetical protein
MDRTEEMNLASFLFAALSSLLKLNGEEISGGRDLLPFALEDFEQL